MACDRRQRKQEKQLLHTRSIGSRVRIFYWSGALLRRGILVKIVVRLLALSLLAQVCNLLADTVSAKSYLIQTVAGSDTAGDGGPAVAASFSQTEGIAVDGAGAIYVADADDNRVRQIGLDGTIRTVAGTGISGFQGDGGPATAALLSHPYGLAVDAAGNLYIADLGNARIRKVSTDG